MRVVLRFGNIGGYCDRTESTIGLVGLRKELFASAPGCGDFAVGGCRIDPLPQGCNSTSRYEMTEQAQYLYVLEFNSRRAGIPFAVDMNQRQLKAANASRLLQSILRWVSVIPPSAGTRRFFPDGFWCFPPPPGPVVSYFSAEIRAKLRLPGALVAE